MTDTKRIQGLILTVGQRAALGSPLHEDEAAEVTAALDELAPMAAHRDVKSGEYTH